MAEIPTEALEAAAQDKVYAAAGLAMVRAHDDDEEDNYFEWHECIDRPACNTVATGGPCPCAGMPWPSEVVQAGINAALAAAAPHLIAEGRRQAAADIRAVDTQRIANLDGDTVRIGLTVAARIAEANHG
jgi:hypothetical protein